MSEPTYTQAIKQAWSLTWRNKILWIFGLLSVFLGQFGVGNFIGHLWQQYNGVPWIGWPAISAPNLNTALGIIWVGGILIGLGIIILLAAVISQAALISAAAKWYKHKKIPSTEELWHKSVDRFWPLLLVNILRQISLCLLLLLFGYIWMEPLLNGGYFSITLAAASLTVDLFLVMTISSVFIYACGYLVADGDTLGAAIRKGWRLFSRHMLVSLELNIILFILSTALILIILAGLIVLMLPAIIIWLVAGFANSAILVTVGLAVACFLFLIFIALCGAVFNTFSTSAWIYLFMKMRHEGIVSRMAYLFKKILKK